MAVAKKRKYLTDKQRQEKADASIERLLQAEEDARIAKQLGRDCCQGAGEECCVMDSSKPRQSNSKFTQEKPPKIVFNQTVTAWGDDYYYRGIKCEILEPSATYNTNHKVETLHTPDAVFTVYRQPDWSFILVKLGGYLKLRAVKC